jgi:hypothetical protein
MNGWLTISGDNFLLAGCVCKGRISPGDYVAHNFRGHIAHSGKGATVTE